MIRGQGRIDSDGLLAGGDYRLHQHAISTHQGRSVLEMMLSASSQSNRPLCWTLPVRPNLSSQCCRPSWPSGNGQSVVGDAVLERAANQDVWSQANETPSASACWSAAATFIAALDQLSADRYGGRMHDVPRGRPGWPRLIATRIEVRTKLACPLHSENPERDNAALAEYFARRRWLLPWARKSPAALIPATYNLMPIPSDHWLL